MINRQSDNADASKENESSTNPINYDSSNPRSVKNLSYIDTNFEKEDVSAALPKRMMRRKPKSLSVEDRIQSLKDSEEDKQLHYTSMLIERKVEYNRRFIDNNF